jgi:hypothetical protein
LNMVDDIIKDRNNTIKTLMQTDIIILDIQFFNVYC